MIDQTLPEPTEKKWAWNKKTIAATVIAFGLVFWAGISVGQKTAYHVEPGTLDFSLFWDAYNKLQANFVDPSKITDQRVLYGAIEGMAQSTGDAYTDFFPPEEAKRMQQDLAGSFEGIGAEIGKKKGRLTVVAPLEGTPAQKAGIQSGDIILKIDGADTANMSIDEAVGHIRGKRGTKIVLNVYRDGWDGPKDFTIVRDTIKTIDLKWELKGDVAYIQMFQFDRTLPADFRAAANEIMQSKAKKIVLDLRDNPGGFLDVAQDIAGWFLEKGQTVTIEDYGKGKDQDMYKSEGEAQLVKYPTVILMNEGSASASEILAGALRDNRKVQLIGAQSFGKGSVQNILEMPGGALLKVTIAKWLTPKGTSISDVGLTPDVSVEISDEDRKADKDPQLEKALEIIQGLQ